MVSSVLRAFLAVVSVTTFAGRMPATYSPDVVQEFIRCLSVTRAALSRRQTSGARARSVRTGERGNGTRRP